MSAVGTLFFSYRRSQLDTVRPVVDALRRAGVEVFFDQDAIDPLASFPDKIRQGIAASHALLAWWSQDYGESDHCLAEYRLAWSHARRHSADVAQRLWVVNPEADAGHISAGEANASNFLRPPKAGEEQAWAENLRDKLQALLPCGPLNDERQLPPAPVRYPNPFPRGNPHFTGRNRELMRIHSLLHPPRIGGQASNVALHAHGLGGIGKTELALQYAEQFQAAYPGGVYWLNLAGFDPERFSADNIEENAKHAWAHAVFSALGEQIGLTVNEENKPFPADALRQKLAEHLAASGDFLWIVDNVPPLRPADRRERILADWQAPAAQGRTLITSRDSLALAGYTPLALERLSHEDSQRLLAQYRLPLHETEKCACTDIANQLGGHPLALTLAGHALNCVYDNSEHPYADLHKNLIARAAVPTLENLAERLRPELGDKASGILASIDISVRTLSEAAWRLLQLAATCASNLPIPKALLALAYHPNDPSQAPTRELLRVGLLQALSDDNRVRMHPLVAEASFALLMVTAEEREALREELANALRVRLQDEEAQRASISREDDAAQAQELVRVLRGEASWLLQWAMGDFLRMRGHYSEARGHQENVLVKCKAQLGEDHPSFLGAIGNLAITQAELGELDSAAVLAKQVLRGFQQLDGRTPISMLTAMSNLASILNMQGKLSDARALQEKVLEQYLEDLGDKHPLTLSAIRGLSITLFALGDLPVARILQEHVLMQYLYLYGDDHPLALRIMSDLAVTVKAQGELILALDLQKLALEKYQQLLGKTHPGSLNAMHNLVATLTELGRLKDACLLQETVLAGYRKQFKDDHPYTLKAMQNLAIIFEMQGNLIGARALLEQVLGIR